LNSRSMGVVTINGQPSFLLTKLRPEEFEEIILIQNRIRAELSLNKLRKQAAVKGLDKITAEELDSLITKSRQARTR